MGKEAETKGQWLEEITLKNVPVHASLLPNGKVLYWGRRANPKLDPSTNTATLDEHSTKAFVWDPSTKESVPTANAPLGLDNQEINLFCGGHCFQPDGTLLIVGGHIKDGVGLNQACEFNFDGNKFTPKSLMNGGRWYPSALPLPDGRVLVISGSTEGYHPNTLTQIWPADFSKANSWMEVTSLPARTTPDGILHLYPRVHLTPKGQVFMAGPQADSWLLNDVNTMNVDNKKTFGTWVPANMKPRDAGIREYAASVLYDTGKIMYIGGGGDDGSTTAPTNAVEFVDLNEATPKWTRSAATDMKYARGQLNATVLPDGTVLVTGGTKGINFNNLDPANVVHIPELWDPKTGKWTEMATEPFDRCYHSTALLLPDGRVLSGGGGEYGGCKAKDCLANAVLYEPPYLTKGGTRPSITTWPSDIPYNNPFDVTLGSSDPIDRVSWVRLGSVTHCRNMNQSLMFLQVVKQTGTKLTISAPANANLAPPGHYMLFVLNKQGVPSKAPIIRISKEGKPLSKPSARVVEQFRTPAPTIQPTLLEHNERVIKEQDRPPVVVGLTPVCPYGLGACWAGAYKCLHRVNDVDVVQPVADQNDSVAFVYLKQDGTLPDVDVWRKEFANASYDMRGIELTVSGAVTKDGEKMTLPGSSAGAQLILAPFQQSSQLKYDIKEMAPRPITDAEAGAYQRLSTTLSDNPGKKVQITGTLQKQGDNQFSLYVRDFEVVAS